MNRRAFAYLATFVLIAALGWTSGQMLVVRHTNAADGPAQKPTAPPTEIALLDVGKVFKECAEFNREMAILRADMVASQALFKEKQAKLSELTEAQASLKKGSEEFKREDRRLAELKNELQIEVAEKQRDIMQKEGDHYYRIYQRISERTAAFAREKKFKTVLRYNSELIDREDRNSVLQGVNNMVIFQDNLDITDEIIRRVNALPEKP